MRVYMPVVGSELGGEHPPVRTSFTAVPFPDTDREGLEVLEDDAQTEAALASLTVLRDRGGEPARRLILALDIPGKTHGGPGILEVEQVRATWEQVRAILADAPEACAAVQAVIDADDQDSADDAVAALWDHALEWYDITERHSLLAAVRGTTTTIPRLLLKPPTT